MKTSGGVPSLSFNPLSFPIAADDDTPREAPLVKGARTYRPPPRQPHPPAGAAVGEAVARRRRTPPTRVQYQPPEPPSRPADSTEDAADDAGSASPSSRSTPSLPMTPAVALKHFVRKLTPFEMSEILEMDEVYFVGNTKKKVRGVPQGAQNNGYDDSRGDYRIVPGDHLLYRYEIVSVLGSGSFGQVVKVIDHKTKDVMALKLIRNKQRFQKQAKIEVRLLEHIMSKDPEGTTNIVRMHSSFSFRNHLCIAFELMSLNLYEYTKMHSFRGFPLSLVRTVARQLLVSLQFLRQLRVIHCDLKPENVLLKPGSKTEIRLIDFGSSCFDDQCVYTYIQSRFYRSPEVILGMDYGMEIDMWSFGCILAELLTGYPIFPGENETEQMQCMMELLNVPPPSMFSKATRTSKFFNRRGEPRVVPNSRGRKRRAGTRSFAEALNTRNMEFIDFLDQCLSWDPRQRLTPAAGLAHPFITGGSLSPERSSRQMKREASTLSQWSAYERGGGRRHKHHHHKKKKKKKKKKPHQAILEDGVYNNSNNNLKYSSKPPVMYGGGTGVLPSINGSSYTKRSSKKRATREKFRLPNVLDGIVLLDSHRRVHTRKQNSHAVVRERNH